ncbi:MAG TPA: regulatory protein RecX [Pseudonocardiaceae bacterium]|jgi:regulatory protein|nr:regulatory protein RecX [Pseudonocardiaceae bacterium]
MTEFQRGRRGRKTRDGQPPEPPADPIATARETCLRLLADRPRTRAELEKKLAAKGIDQESADLVLGRLDAVGLIDDAAFAEQYVQSRHRYQGMAKRALMSELRRKGVDNEVAAEAAGAVDGEAEESRARDLVRKRLRSVSTQDELTKIRRLVGMLARKGYPEGLAYRVVREELREAGTETDLLDTTPE